MSQVESGLLTVRLPRDNLFGLKGADRSGQSVGHGWVVLLDPLAPGSHTITVHTAGTYLGGPPFDTTVVTTIDVVA